MTVLDFDLDLADGVYDGEATWEGMIRNPLTSLTAAAIPVKPPTAWFTNPGFAQLEPLTVTADGQIAGHIASWREDHIGMNGRVKAPRSKSGYAFFATGSLETAEGRLVNVGQITLTGGHASIEASVAEAVAHYDNTNSAFADVAVGEDKHGIWVAGALRPTVDDGQLRAIRASSVSGDWRPINGSLEMVAVCAVNVPGFPIPRARVAAGVPIALIAAGTGELVDLMMHHDTTALDVASASFDDRLRFMEDVVLGRIGDSRQALTAAVEAARDVYQADEDDTAARVAALRASVHAPRIAALRASVHAPRVAALRASVHPEQVTAAALRTRVHGGGGAVPFGDGPSPLVAARSFNPDLHPKGRDGKWITKFGTVKILAWKMGGNDLSGQRAEVTDIKKDPSHPGHPWITLKAKHPRTGDDMTLRVKADVLTAAQDKARLDLPAQSAPKEFGKMTPQPARSITAKELAPDRPTRIAQMRAADHWIMYHPQTMTFIDTEERNPAQMTDAELSKAISDADYASGYMGSNLESRQWNGDLAEERRIRDIPNWPDEKIEQRLTVIGEGQELMALTAEQERRRGGQLPTPAAVTAAALRSQVHDLWDDGMPIDLDISECRQVDLRARVNGGIVARATSAWTAEERDKAAARGAAMPGGRFPITDCTDVGKAVRALGRGKGDKAAIRRHIIRRARSLGCMDAVPADWK